MLGTTPFWEQQLHEIREQVLLMCGLTERNLALAMRALTERDDRLADLVESEDTEIDHLELHIDELVVTFISTRGAVASDTRLVLTASKIASDLERIADEATTIARRARELNGEPFLHPPTEISVMGTTAREMLQEAIGAFVEKQTEEAIQIIARDKTVDDIYKQVVRSLTATMIADVSTVGRNLKWMTIAKALERIADHATNIAEEVFYLYNARDIRHDHSLKGRN